MSRNRRGRPARGPRTARTATTATCQQGRARSPLRSLSRPGAQGQGQHASAHLRRLQRSAHTQSGRRGPGWGRRAGGAWRPIRTHVRAGR